MCVVDKKPLYKTQNAIYLPRNKENCVNKSYSFINTLTLKSNYKRE